MARRTREMKRTPRMLPTMIRAVDFQYASAKRNDGHALARRNAGNVKIAPAATDSPIDPAVRAIFSSSRDPFQARIAAIAITAAGYVAAIVMPARNPRYALAAPRTIVIRSPSSTARRVN